MKNTQVLPSFFTRKPLLVSILAGAFFLGLCFTAWLNRAEIILIITQLGTLWAIPSNRPEIVRLIFKLLVSGITFAALALAGFLAYSVLISSSSQPSTRSTLLGATALPQNNVSSRHLPVQEPVGEQELPASPWQEEEPQKPLVEQSLSTTPMQDDAPLIADGQSDRASVIHADKVQESVQPYVAEPMSGDLHLCAQELAEENNKLITITLLKTVTMTLHGTDGREYPVNLDVAPKSLQLLAYVAWPQGKKVALGWMRHQVFGHGLSDEEETLERVQEGLNTAKRELRGKIRQTIEQANTAAGAEVLPSHLDIFSLGKKKYWLPEHCHVCDLAAVEAQHHIIQQAFEHGLLVNSVPKHIKDACDTLMKAYTGDFLEDLLTDDDSDSFEPWTSSWAREPFTLYRDYYLQAVWYAAEYERKAGDQLTEAQVNDTKAREQQRLHYAEAARLFRTYAMAACNSRIYHGRFDTKVTFGGAEREPGERVTMSEQALRRCLTLYGKLGSTHLVGPTYSNYEKQMRLVSGKAWKPSQQTIQDRDAAKEHTGAYRFPEHITPHDLPAQQIQTESAS